MEAIPVIPAHAICFWKDGTAWCCANGDFVSLQESPAGFGDSMGEAMDSLHAQISELPKELAGVKP
jgi:hypothetical protein